MHLGEQDWFSLAETEYAIIYIIWVIERARKRGFEFDRSLSLRLIVKEFGLYQAIIKTFPQVVTYLNKPGNWLDQKRCD